MLFTGQLGLYTNLTYLMAKMWSQIGWCSNSLRKAEWYKICIVRQSVRRSKNVYRISKDVHPFINKIYLAGDIISTNLLVYFRIWWKYFVTAKPKAYQEIETISWVKLVIVVFEKILRILTNGGIKAIVSRSLGGHYIHYANSL